MEMLHVLPYSTRRGIQLVVPLRGSDVVIEQVEHLYDCRIGISSNRTKDFATANSFIEVKLL